MLSKVALLALITMNSFGLEFKIVGACSTEPIFKSKIAEDFTNLGLLTNTIFKENNIAHLSSDYGVSQIFNSPVGLDAIEIISDYKMRSHGWCYSVDGVVPEVLMSDYVMLGDEKLITWFMGYTTYTANPETGEEVWSGQCTPSNLPPAMPSWCN